VGVEQVAEASAAMHELWDEGLVVDCLVKYTSVMPLLVYCKHSGNIHVSDINHKQALTFTSSCPAPAQVDFALPLLGLQLINSRAQHGKE
jgi:hypothetical protein